MESEMLESTKNFLRDELTCKLCHGLYRMPTLLPCFHSFCHCCVSGRVTKEKRRSLWGLFSNKEKYFIDCIICKCIHNLSKHGVDTLVRNFLLEAITDSYREKIGLKTVLKDCQLCENQDKVLPAVKYCFKCDLSYCAICMQKYHPTRGQYTKHDVAELCRETKLRCPEHHDLTLDFYCIQCHIPSCGACRTLNHHSNHQIVDIVGIYNNVKEIVTSQTVELARRNGQNKTFMNAAITFEKTAKDGGEGLKMHVRKTCQELRKIIDAREKSMIDTIDREVQGRLQKLKMKVSEIHRHWPESDGLQKLTQEVINAKTDPASFLLIADKLRERIADNLKGYNVIGYSYVLTNPLGEWTMFNTASAKKMLESIRIAGRPKPQTSSTANGAQNEVSPRIDRYGEGDVVVEMAGEIPGHMVSLVETGKPLEQNNNNDRVPENFGSRANTDVTQQPRNLERPTTEFSVRQSEKQEGRSLSSESSDAESPPSPTITPSESPPLNFASSPTSARVNFPNFGKVPFNPSQTENNNFGTTTKSATTRNNSFEQNRISPDLKGTENRPCNKLSRDKQPHTVEAGSTLSDATGRGSSIIPANRNNQNCDPVGSYMKFVQRRQQFEVQGQSPLSAANSAVAQNKWSQNQHGRQTGTPSAGTGEHSLTPQAPGEVAHVQSAIVAKAANWDSNQHILKAQTPSADQAEENIIPCNKPNSESIAQKWRTNDSSGTNGKRSTAIHGATPTLASNNSNAQTKSYPGFTRRVNCTSTDSTSNRKDETTVRTSGGLASNSRSEVGSSLQRRNATTRNGATNSCTQSKLPTPVRDHRIVGNRYNENLQSSSTYNVYGTSRTDSSKIPVLIGTGTYSPVPTKKFQNDNFSPDINDGSLDSLPSATVNGQCNVHSAHTVQTFAASNERVATHNPHNSTNVRQQGINSSKVTRAGDDQVTQKSLNTMLSFRTNTVHPTDQTGVQASAIPAGTVQPNVSMPPSQTFNTSNATKVEVSSSTINNGSNAVSDKRQGTSSTIHHHGSSSGQSDRGPVTASALNVGCTQGRQAARMDMTQTRQGDDFFIDGHSSVLSAKEHTKSGGSATSHTAQIPSDALITEKKNTCPTGIVPLDDNGKIGSGRVSNFALTSADPSRKNNQVGTLCDTQSHIQNKQKKSLTSTTRQSSNIQNGNGKRNSNLAPVFLGDKLTTAPTSGNIAPPNSPQQTGSDKITSPIAASVVSYDRGTKQGAKTVVNDTTAKSTGQKISPARAQINQSHQTSLQHHQVYSKNVDDHGLTISLTKSVPVKTEAGDLSSPKCHSSVPQKMPNKEANIPSPKLSRQTEGVCKEVKQGASKSSANTSHRSVQAIEGAGDSPKSSEATSNKQERGNSNQRNVSMTRNARRQLFDGESCGREDYQCESQVSRLKSKDLEGGPVLLNVDGCLTGYKTEDKKESEHRDNDNDNHDKEMVHRAPTKIRKTTAISFQLDTHTLHEDLVLTEDHKTIERRSSKPKTLQVTPKKVDKEGANIPKIPTTGRFISWSPTVLGDVAMTTGEYYWEVYGTRVSYTGQLDNDLCSFGVTVGDCPRNALLCFHPLGWCFHVYKTGFEGHHNRINQSMCTKFVGDGHDGDSAIHVGVLLSFSNNTLSFYNLQDSNAPSRLRLFENMCSGPLYPAFTVTSLNYQLTVINGLKLPKVLRQQIRQENEERAKRLKETKKPREVKS